MITRPPIRDVIRQVMAERGHSIHDAERAMGMPFNTLWRFLAEKQRSLGIRNIERLAGYLNLPVDDVESWVYRDEGRLRIGRNRLRTNRRTPVVSTPTGTLTWWGPTEERITSNDCRRCRVTAECQEAVNAGRPMPCEGFLEQEIITPEMMFRVSREECE